MPTTAAAGSISLAADNMRTTLAQSAELQDWIGATGTPAEKQAAALARIYDDGLPPPADGGIYTTAEFQAYLPCIILTVGSFRMTSVAEAAHDDSGVFFLNPADVIDPTILDDYGEIGRQFLNRVGVILDELAAMSEVGENLIIDTMEMTRPWEMTDEDRRITEGPVVEAQIRIDWGGRGAAA